MSGPLPGTGAVLVRRSYLVDTDRLTGVVVEIDATGEPDGLAVLQASLHELPEGLRLGFGYDLAPAGLAAWIGDRRIRLRVWPVLVDDDGVVTGAGPPEDERVGPDIGPDAGDEDEPVVDLLVIDFDPVVDAEALAGMQRTGRVIIAGPEAGPVPLVLDIDPDLVTRALAELGGPG